MNEPENKMCHVCNNTEILPDDVLCQACSDYINPEACHDRWGSPGPEDPPNLPRSPRGHEHHELSEANLDRYSGRTQSEAASRRRAELSTSYRQTLYERQRQGDTREQALEYVRNSHEQNDDFASVAASEDAEFNQVVRADAYSQVRLRYRQLLADRTENNREPRSEALEWVRQHMENENRISSVAASEEEEYQRKISTESRLLGETYRDMYQELTRNGHHSREVALAHIQGTLGHHVNFAEVAAMEEEEHQSYLIDEENASRRRLSRAYCDELRNRMENDRYTRDEALSWLRRHMGSHADFASVALSEADSYDFNNGRHRTSSRSSMDVDGDDN